MAVYRSHRRRPYRIGLIVAVTYLFSLSPTPPLPLSPSLSFSLLLSHGRQERGVTSSTLGSSPASPASWRSRAAATATRATQPQGQASEASQMPRLHTATQIPSPNAMSVTRIAFTATQTGPQPSRAKAAPERTARAAKYARREIGQGNPARMTRIR